LKDTTASKYPVIFSTVLAIILVVLISIFSAAAQIAGLGDRELMISQGIAFIIMAIFAAAYMKKRGKTLSIFGFNKLELSKSKQTLYYVPLLIIALIQPIMGGINTSLTFVDILITLLYCAFVGFTEETIFRGIIKEKLQHKGHIFYITFSSILFGVLHMANALMGIDVIYIVLQVINALLVGVILALLIVVKDTIIPLIVFHFLFDFLAMITNSNTFEKDLMVVVILNIVYVLYGIYLVVMLLGRKKGEAI
jgi:membrane protease YdiL (CAAX protease family)